MRPWQKLLARAGHLRPLLLAHQSLPAPFPDAGLTTPEPNKSLFPCQQDGCRIWNWASHSGSCFQTRMQVICLRSIAARAANGVAASASWPHVWCFASERQEGGHHEQGVNQRRCRTQRNSGFSTPGGANQRRNPLLTHSADAHPNAGSRSSGRIAKPLLKRLPSNCLTRDNCTLHTSHPYFVR